MNVVRIKLQDVAALAGVSEATVSRVMNSKPGVAVVTRERVLKVLAELGYRPAGLDPAPHVGSVGLVVPELVNPVFPAFAQEIESNLLAMGYVSVLCCASRAGTDEREYIEVLRKLGASGFVVVSGHNADINGEHRLYHSLVADGVPLVFVNGPVAGLDSPTVSSNDRAAAGTAYEHLHALGHDRIGLSIGPDRYHPVIRKREGFAAAALAAGVSSADVDDRIVSTMFTLEGGSVAAGRLLDQGITGIVAASDMMAIGAIQAVRDRGLRVPEDISVVGYDDTPLMRFTDPPLTTIHQRVDVIAEHASSLLQAQIEGTPYDRGEVLVSGDLVARNSTARCPSRSLAT